MNEREREIGKESLGVVEKEREREREREIKREKDDLLHRYAVGLGASQVINR